MLSKKPFDLFKTYQFTFDADDFFQSCAIPKPVESCPCCSSRLFGRAEYWELSDEGFWVPETIKFHCKRDLENDLQCYKEYKNSEIWNMPYVYWLPVETRCTDWINKMLRIYWKLDPVPLRWLEKNGQGRLFQKV